MEIVIRPRAAEDYAAIFEIVNDAAAAYRGILARALYDTTSRPTSSMGHT